MANIGNREVTRRIEQDGGIQTSEGVPTTLRSDVQPVLVSNPRQVTNRVDNVIRISSGTSTLFTSSATKKTYITGFSISTSKDDVCDNNTAELRVKIGGATKIIGYQASYGATGGATEGRDKETFLTFPHPIQIDKNSVVDFQASFSNGVMHSAVVVYSQEVVEQ